MPANGCRYCGSANLVTTRCEPPSPHHARTDCQDCGRFQRWAPAPMTFERARTFAMPFGKRQGQTLEQIGSTEDGLRYLDWLLDQVWLKPSLRRVIQCYLAHHTVTPRLDRAIGD